VTYRKSDGFSAQKGELRLNSSDYQTGQLFEPGRGQETVVIMNRLTRPEPAGMPAAQKPVTQAATPAPVPTPTPTVVPPPPVVATPVVVAPAAPVGPSAEELRKYQQATNLLINDDADYRNVIVTYLMFPGSNRWQSAYRRLAILRQAQDYARAHSTEATQMAVEIGFFRPAPAGERRNVSVEMAQWIDALASKQLGRPTGATIQGTSVMGALGLRAGATLALLMPLIMTLIVVGGLVLIFRRRKE